MQILFTEPFIVCVDLLYIFFLDKILSIDKIDSLYFHGSLQCIVIQNFSLNVVQSSNFIQVLILTKNHHFSKLVLIYGITTMKSTSHSNGSSSCSVIQNLVPNFRCSASLFEPSMIKSKILKLHICKRRVSQRIAPVYHADNSP